MSNNNNNIESGERLSFYKLFAEKGYHIEIPIIQRDYAQGRKSKSEIRETFLSSLYNYLEENIPNRDLDFIYGSIEKSIYTKFIPLDGQQRLTTLFLLHWYLSNISGNFKEFRSIISVKKDNEYKSKFTYETRTSSREFCNEIISYNLNIDNLLEPDKGQDNSLSKTIQNMSWYYLSWKNDPTIQSMLIMLDAIHNKFNKNPDFYVGLTRRSIITFQFLNLKEFELTDDLYIKMNARGKSLTTFENFKAKFLQYLDELNKNKKIDKTYTLYFNEKDKNVSIKEYFSYMIDAVWTNLFWNYRTLTNSKSDIEDNDYDDELMNLIRVVFTSQYASDLKLETDDNFEYLIGGTKARRKKEYSDIITFSKYKKLNSLSPKSIYYLIDTIESLYNDESKIKIHLSNTFYFDEEAIFSKVLLHDLSSQKRVQFHSYIQYLIRNKENLNNINEWMRFVHNMTENTIIDSPSEIVNAIKFIDKLLPYSNTILPYLTSNRSELKSINQRQLLEEIIKAHLIIKSKVWKTEIERVEKISFFKGQIGFVLEFAGILSYFKENSGFNWTDKDNNIYLKKFIDYANKAKALFELIGSDKNKKFIVERTILAKGNYLIPATNDKYNFSSSRKVKNYERDYSWKRLLRADGSKEWKKRRTFVKEVLDDSAFNIGNLEKSLRSIRVESNLADWRLEFVNKYELIKYCKQGFIHKKSNIDITLLKETQFNHYHRELFSYILFLNCKDNIKLYKPFNHCEHIEVKSSEAYSHTLLSGLNINEEDYKLEIYYDISTNFLQNPYEVRFSSMGKINSYEYPENIEKIINKHNMIWKGKEEELAGYWLSFEDEKRTIDFLQKLSTDFSKLKLWTK